MKRQITFSAFILLTCATLAMAQSPCTPNPATGTPGYFPTPDNVPCIERNVPYNFTMHLENFVTINSPALGTLSVNWLRIDSIENLPCGISWLSNKLQYDPGETGCINISGTTSEAVGQYPLKIYATYNVTILGSVSGELKSLAAQAGLTADYRYVSRVIEPGNSCPARDVNSTSVTSDVCPLCTSNAQCNDNNACTTDGCVQLIGCTHTNICCTPDAATGTPGFFPTPDSVPCIERNVPYNFTMHLENFVTINSPALGTLSVNWLRIDSIENLPCGISWRSNKLQYIPGETGCITFYGTTSEVVGQYPLKIYVTYDVTGLGPFSGELKNLAAQAGLTADYRYVSRVIEQGNACPAKDINSTSVASGVCNDDCSSIDPVTLTNGTPVTFTGTTVGATASTEELSILGYGAVWEAVTLTRVCNNLTVDYCGTTAGVMVAAFALFADCPLTSFVRATNYDYTTCTDGNITVHFDSLPAGPFYLPVLADAAFNIPGYYTMNVLSETCPVSISGSITTQIGIPVPNVTVTLTGSSSYSDLTASDGLYSINAEPGNTYVATPFKNNDTTSNCGVTTLDILIIRSHILSRQTLVSPYKIIAAATVNSATDVTISTIDLIWIRSMILGNIKSFPGKRLWTFVPSDFIFANPLTPFPYNDFKSNTNIYTSLADQNFIAIRLGDVNDDCDPTFKTAAVGELQVIVDEYNTQPGDEITIPIKVKDFKSISGYQFTLSWDAEVLSLLGINNKSLKGFYGENKTSEGRLTTS